MLFPRSLLLALVSSPFLALAQNPNPFNIPAAGLSFTAGNSSTLSWSPTTQGTVSLVLRSGNSANLNAGMLIASKIPNSGSYTWNVPSEITRGSDYTIEIVDDATPSETNYTPYFVIDSQNTVAYSTSDVSLGAPTATVSGSTVSPTGSASSFLSTVSTTQSVSGSAAASVSSAAASASSAAASHASSVTATASGSSSHTSSGTATSIQVQTQSASAGAARATAMAGVLGVVAMGAFAL